MVLLYATGFNAWNQLQFEARNAEEEPDDLLSFTCVLQGEDDGAIDRMRAPSSYTLGQ